MRKTYAILAVITILMICTGCNKNMKKQPNSSESTACSTEATETTAETASSVQEPIFGLGQESPEDFDEPNLTEGISDTTVPSTQAAETAPENTTPENPDNQTEPPAIPGAPSANLSGETPED